MTGTRPAGGQANKQPRKSRQSHSLCAQASNLLGQEWLKPAGRHERVKSYSAGCASPQHRSDQPINPPTWESVASCARDASRKVREHSLWKRWANAMSFLSLHSLGSPYLHKKRRGLDEIYELVCEAGGSVPGHTFTGGPNWLEKRVVS